MGKQAIKSHMEGKKHIQCNNSVDHNFFKPSKKDQTKQDHIAQQTTSTAKQCCSSSSSTHQTTLELTVKSEGKIKTEIMWVLRRVMSGQSNNSNKDIKVLFQTMFSDSQVAKNFEMGQKKQGMLSVMI